MPSFLSFIVVHDGEDAESLIHEPPLVINNSTVHEYQECLLGMKRTALGSMHTCCAHEVPMKVLVAPHCV